MQVEAEFVPFPLDPEEFTDEHLAAVSALIYTLANKTELDAVQISLMIGAFLDAHTKVSVDFLNLLKSGIAADGFAPTLFQAAQRMREMLPEPLMPISEFASAQTAVVNERDNERERAEERREQARRRFQAFDTTDLP